MADVTRLEPQADMAKTTEMADLRKPDDAVSKIAGCKGGLQLMPRR